MIFRSFLNFYTDNSSIKEFFFTLKNASEEPPAKHPYCIFVCRLRSSALSIGISSLSTVKKAAKFAVYEEIRINVNIDHAQFRSRVDGAWGLISIPRI